MMLSFHHIFTNAGELRYRKIPYLRRCRSCKRKADMLFTLDSSKSWGYHLNTLPTCPNDELVPQKTTLEQIITLEKQNFAFHIPEGATVLWGISTTQYVERPWIPHEEFSSQELYGNIEEIPFEEIIGELKKRLRILKKLETGPKSPFVNSNDKPQWKSQPMNKVKLRDLLVEYFNSSELHNLCFDLNIKHENIAGNTLTDKARELIEYCVRYGRFDALVNRCRELRPHVNWSDNVQEFPKAEILDLLRKHNDDWCKVLTSDGDIRYLDATTTPRGLFRAKQDAEDEVECMFDDEVKSCSFLNLDLVNWQLISNNKFKVIVDEFWEDHYINHKKLRATQRNIYEVVFFNDKWLIDCCDTLEQIDILNNDEQEGSA